MNTVLHPVLVRVRRLRAFIAASLRKMLGLEAHDGDFASQRMCPFCGLITPRFETCCLECGKVLKAAQDSNDADRYPDVSSRPGP